LTAYLELEIGLRRKEAESYSVEFCLSHPESDVDGRLGPREQPVVQFHLNELRDLELDPKAYGKSLSNSLFESSTVTEALAVARTLAQEKSCPLRIRLFVGPNTPELHNIRWETLLDPVDLTPLLIGENVLFSRYLGSFEWRPVHPRRKCELRALVVIANPNNLEEYRSGGRSLASIDVKGEIDRARASLGSMLRTELASGGSATLDKISGYLRDGFDILYLVCHGALINGESHLWLEDETGRAARIKGSELIEQIRKLRQVPELVVLASCQSAGTGNEPCATDEGALSALGPLMAEVGVPAVLAMQGNVSMRSVASFMPKFFKELQRDGQIDLAISVARNAIRSEPDWWMPVLFMRLKSGRLWYEPGFAGDPTGFKKWPALQSSIYEDKHATPILGPGILEELFGSTREISRLWADQYHFPMSPFEREELPKVAQYLAIDQSPQFPCTELCKYMRKNVLERYENILTDEIRNASADKLLEFVAAKHWERNALEAHRILAQPPFPIYITTNHDNILARALKAEGKEPEIEICRWNDDIMQNSIFEREKTYVPSEKRPLVYHFFGNLSDPNSLVLTEDDYFKFLIGVTLRKDLIPPVVKRALTQSALLFIGFHIEDWNFRVLFRSIMSQEGSTMLKRYPHVAVQIDPEGGRIIEPEGARRYLESYFLKQEASISIYWGNAEDFTQELYRHRPGGA